MKTSVVFYAVEEDSRPDGASAIFCPLEGHHLMVPKDPSLFGVTMGQVGVGVMTEMAVTSGEFPRPLLRLCD